MTTHKPTSDKKSTGAWRRPGGVICVPLAPTVNRPLQAQLLRPQRRKWHKSLALERPLSSPKGAAYRHNPDVDWQPADSIKFVFSGATASSARHHAAAHRGRRGVGSAGPRGTRKAPQGPARPRLVPPSHAWGRAAAASLARHQVPGTRTSLRRQGRPCGRERAVPRPTYRMGCGSYDAELRPGAVGAPRITPGRALHSGLDDLPQHRAVGCVRAAYIR